MPSLISGYEYDIFISYRQKDNKGNHWVTTFVNTLKTELESTFKEDISIYFDENSHDGLLENYNVDRSLEGKLKCLILIPIISQTYCDANCFAWQHEFVAFNKRARDDQFGIDIKLSNGNVTSRILPVKIYDLDDEDQAIIEHEIGGPLRAIEFIYREPGVNRPLQYNEETPGNNQNRTYYRNQVNKVANAVKEIVYSLITPPSQVKKEPAVAIKIKSSNRKKIYIGSFLFILLLVAGYFSYRSIQSVNTESNILVKSIAIMPFADLTPDGDYEWFADGLCEEILNSLYPIPELQVRGRNSSFAFKGKNLTISQFADSLDVNYVVEGTVRKFNENLRVTVQLIKATGDVHLWSDQYDMKSGDVFLIQSEIANKIAQVLNIYLDEEEREKMFNAGTRNTEAYEYFLKGKKLYHTWHDTDSEVKLWDANKWFDQALKLDPNIALAYYYRSDAFSHYYHDDIDGPDSTLQKPVAWQEYLWNLKKAIQYEQDPSIKLIFEIEQKLMSDDWSGLNLLTKKLSNAYRPSPFVSSENILPFITMTEGPDAALDILEQDILQDPKNAWLWDSYANILIYQGKIHAASLIIEKLRKLNGPYASKLFLNLLLSGGKKQTFDSILYQSNGRDDMNWNYNYWMGNMQSYFQSIADSIIIKGDSDNHLNINVINSFWQKGDEKMNIALTNKLDETFTSGSTCTGFYLDLTSQFAYHIPFNMDSAPNFKKKLNEAGIDPGLFKTMPRFDLE